jgi:hypothetical protein
LRLTNHQLHHLIHDNESTITRNYLSQELELLQRIFKPAESLTLNYRIDLTCRLLQVRRLATLLAGRCSSKLKPQQPVENGEVWRTKKIRKLRDMLMTGLFALCEFLAQFRQVVLRSLHDFEGYSSDDFARFGFVLGIDQQRIFETFPTESFRHITQAWRILEGVANAKGISLSCRAAKYPYTSVKALVVLGGLDRFECLLSTADLKERLEDLNAFNDELWHGRVWKPYKKLSGAPLKSIRHLARPATRVSSGDFPQGTPPTAPLTFINRQHICEPSISAVILRCVGTLDNVPAVDRYICDAVREEGDPDFVLLPWSQPDPD